MGVSEPPDGVQMYGGIQMYRGHKKYGSIQTPPSIKHMTATKKSLKNLFVAKFLYLKSWKKD